MRKLVHGLFVDLSEVDPKDLDLSQGEWTNTEAGLDNDLGTNTLDWLNDGVTGQTGLAGEVLTDVE